MMILVDVVNPKESLRTLAEVGVNHQLFLQWHLGSPRSYSSLRTDPSDDVYQCGGAQV
jgi:hypothetical protein